MKTTAFLLFIVAFVCSTCATAQVARQYQVEIANTPEIPVVFVSDFKVDLQPNGRFIQRATKPADASTLFVAIALKVKDIQKNYAPGGMGGGYRVDIRLYQYDIRLMKGSKTLSRKKGITSAPDTVSLHEAMSFLSTDPQLFGAIYDFLATLLPR